MARPVVSTLAVPGTAVNTKTLTIGGEPLRGEHVLAFKSNWGTAIYDTDYGENQTAWTNNGECRNKAYYRKLRDKWRLNTVRFLVYRDIRSAYPTNWFAWSEIIPVIDDAVTICAELGLVLIIDYHPVPCGRKNWSTDNPTTGKTDAYLPSGFTNFQVDCEAFWDYVAPRYKDDQHVIYECMNESFGPWGAGLLDNFYANTAALAWHDSIYARVRALAPNTPILNFSLGQSRGYESGAHDMLDVFNKNGNINYSNSVAAFHGYSQNKPSVERLVATLPGVMSEYVDANTPPTSFANTQKNIDYWESRRLAWIMLKLEWMARTLPGQSLNIYWPVVPGGGSPPATDKTYYVATTGTDGAGVAGAIGTPWKTITYGMTRCAADLAAGKAVTLLVRGGTYQEEVLVNVSGTSETKRFTLKAFEGELVYVDGRADLGIADPAWGSTDTAAWNAGGRNRVLPLGAASRCSIRYPDRCFHSKALLWVYADYVTVDGINVRYSRGRGFHAGGKSYADMKGYIKVVNCTVDRAYANGLTTLYGHHVEVAYNDIQHTGDFSPYDRLGSVENWPGALAINQCNNIHVHHNTVHEVQAEGILCNTEADTVLIEFNIVYNTFKDTLYHNRCWRVVTRFNIAYHTGDTNFFSTGDRSQGLSINTEPNTAWAANCTDVTMYGNVIKGMLNGINVQAGANGLYPFHNTQIFNNTIVDSVMDAEQICAALRVGGGVHTGDSFIRNNVFVQDNGQGVICDISPVATGLTYSNNAWSQDPALVTNGSLAVGAGDVVGDILLFNRTATVTPGVFDPANYAKGTGSPAINMGAVIPGTYSDYFGAARDTPIDAGFDEWPPNGDPGPPPPPPPPVDPPTGGSGQAASGIVFSSVDTTSGDFDMTSTALGGITPKAALFITSPAVTANTAVDYAKLGIGAATASGEQWAVSERTRHGSATITVSSRGKTSMVSMLQHNSTSAINFEASFSSWITNGARLNKAATQTEGAGITALILGGADLTAKAFTVAASSSIDGTATVDFGFAPDLVLWVRSGAPMTDTNTTDMNMSIGVSTSVANQMCTTWAQGNGTTPTEMQSRTETGFIGRVLWGTAQWWELTNITGNVATITTRNAAGAATIAGLALKFTGLQVYAGTATTPTATGTVASTLPFAPMFAGFINTLLAVTGTTKTNADAGSLGVGFVNATEQEGVTVSSQDAVTTGNTQSIRDTKVMNVPLHDGAAGLVGSASLTATGYSINYTAVQATAKRYMVFAVEKPLVATRAKKRKMGQGMKMGMKAGF